MSALTSKLALAAAAIALASTLGAAELIHNPVLSGPAGEDLDVQAALVGADSNTQVQVRLYYRQRGVEIYRSVVMGGSNSNLDATIPGAVVDVPGVEYYIEADGYSGSNKTTLATVPQSNPALNPIEVVVRKDDSAPVVTVLSPAADESVDSSTPVISASFSDPNGSVDASTVSVKIDDQPVRDKGAIQAYETMVSYVVPQQLADGVHTVSISVSNKAGHTGTVSWSFKVGASASQSSQSRAWSVDGKFWAETQYDPLLKAPALQSTNLPYMAFGANRGDLEVNARGADDLVSLKAYATDEDRSDQQPLDRFNLTWSNREGAISLGDVSPSFSELSLYNLYELRGLELDLRSGPLNEGHTRFVGVWGETVRPVDYGSAPLNGAVTSPVFAQYLYGARWEAGDPWVVFGLNTVTINDDPTSVTNPGSTVPHFDSVETADARINLPFLWLSLSGEGGVDFFAANESFTGISLGSAYEAGAVWDARPLGSKLTFEWRDLGGTFDIGGFPLPGGFSTMANPGLQSDYRGFESAFSQRLMDGKVGINLAENNWRDNLNGNLQATTTTNFANGQVSVNPGTGLPYVSLGYSETNVYNDGLTAIDAFGNTSSQFTNEQTEVYNGSLGYTRSLGKASTGSLNLSYTDTDLADLAPQRTVQNNEAWNAVLAAFYAQGSSNFSANVGVGGSTNPAAFEPAQQTTLPTQLSSNLSLGVHWNQNWDRTPFNSNLGYDRVQTLSNTDAPPAGNNINTPFAQVNNSTRDTISVSGGYKLAKNQKLTLQLAYSMVQVTQDQGQGSGQASDSLDQLFTNLHYDLNF